MVTLKIKHAVKFAAYNVIAGMARAVGETATSPWRILMYHKLNDRIANPLAVGERLFSDQMELLSHTADVRPVSDALATLQRCDWKPSRPVVSITFDDGYADVARVALPELEKRGWAATAYIPSAFVDASRPLPHDMALPWYDGTMTSHQLEELLRAGWEIGGHAVSHRYLQGLPEEVQREEIMDGKAALERSFGPLRSFAYVGGRYDAVTRRLVQECGFESAVTTRTGGNGPESSRFDLKRTNVEPFGLFYFRRVLDGSIDVLSLKDGRLGGIFRAANRLFGMPD